VKNERHQSITGTTAAHQSSLARFDTGIIRKRRHDSNTLLYNGNMPGAPIRSTLRTTAQSGGMAIVVKKITSTKMSGEHRLIMAEHRIKTRSFWKRIFGFIVFQQVLTTSTKTNNNT
jgi:hypothetical protein